MERYRSFVHLAEVELDRPIWSSNRKWLIPARGARRSVQMTKVASGRLFCWRGFGSLPGLRKI